MTSSPLFADRRRVLAVTGSALLLAAAGRGPGARPASAIVEVEQGRLQGFRDQGVSAFWGVPYAAPPVGSGRFAAPRPALPWTGVRQATAFGRQCPQRDLGRDGLFASRTAGQPNSEDCLVLNIWTPAADARKRPVMLWIHGGGFGQGSGSNSWYDGVNLARRHDVVVMTVNHRLNVFGYLYLAELGGPRESGNAGMLDLVECLRWIRANIAAFGGDPGNVTLFGESGGGAKISTLCAMPSAKGLFHKGIIQSGPGVRSRTPDQATASARQLLAQLDIAPGEIGKLRDAPAETLFQAHEAVTAAGRGAVYAPVVDGAALPRHPFDPDSPSISADVPLIIGTNRTETTRLIGARDATTFALDEGGLRRRLLDYYPADAVDEVIASYRKVEPDTSPSELFFVISSDAQFLPGSLQIAERKSAAGRAAAYMYYIDWRTPVDGGRWGSPHGLEIAFVFDNVDKTLSMTGPPTVRTRAISDQMSSAWVAFARTGRPQGARIPTWPAYDAARRSTMIFGDNTRVVEDPRAPLRLQLAATPPARRG
jgi:para-nitrobenzyl esterase